MNVNQYDIVLDLLIVNQTSDTLQNVTLELATLGKTADVLSVTGATSRYFELFFWGRSKLPLIGRKPLNNSLPGLTNTNKARVNQKGTRIVKDGED